VDTKHNFVQLAEVQREQKTLYCGGLDPHSLGVRNWEIYGRNGNGEVEFYDGEIYDF